MSSTSSTIRRWAGRASILLAAGTLAACAVETGPGGHGGGGDYCPRPRPPQACTMEYRPVCGQRGNDRQTFANTCEARSTGYQIVGQGECRRDQQRPERPETRPDRDRACTREYAPVCGQRGRERQTFANACEARSSGYDISGRGECQIARPDRERNPRDRNQSRDRY